PDRVGFAGAVAAALHPVRRARVALPGLFHLRPVAGGHHPLLRHHRARIPAGEGGGGTGRHRHHGDDRRHGGRRLAVGHDLRPDRFLQRRFPERLRVERAQRRDRRAAVVADSHGADRRRLNPFGDSVVGGGGLHAIYPRDAPRRRRRDFRTDKGPDGGQGMLQQTLSRKLIRLVAVALLAGSLAACASDDKPEYVERPVDDLYNAAMNSLMAGNYTEAAEQFDEVERQHPYSIWATKAQLLAAYSHYEADNYDDAIIGLDRFIQLHPSHKDAPYAYYLRALTYYEQITDVGRDQRMTQLALNALDEVVRRYPNTEYARDARLKLDLARDHLAGKEMSV